MGASFIETLKDSWFRQEILQVNLEFVCSDYIIQIFYIRGHLNQKCVSRPYFYSAVIVLFCMQAQEKEEQVFGDGNLKMNSVNI